MLHVTPAAATSLVTVAVKFNACPSTNPPPFGVIVTVKGAAVTVMVAVAVFVVSATEVAVKITDAGFGTLAGAVYVEAVPEALEVGAIVPQAAAVQAVPDRDQVTPLFELSLATAAVNDWLCPVCTDEVAADTVTETGTGGAGCCVDEPPQPPSHATVNITNKIPGVRPTRACVNAALPSSYFRSSRFWFPSLIVE